MSVDSTFKALIDIDPLGWARFVSSLAIGDAHSVDTSLHETQRVVDRLMNVGLGAERMFGPVPKEIRARIESATLENLVEWMSNMRTASSWTELISD